MKNVHITGIGHSPFRKHQASIEALITSVVHEALADANVAAGDVDEIYLGHFNAGLSAQGFVSSLVLQADSALRFKPVHRLENACASGSAAVHAGVRAIQSGQAKQVLVVGVEKMSECADVGGALARASYLPEESQFDSFAGVFGHIAEQYFQRFGNQQDALAMIAEKNHRNGFDNPYAQLRKHFDFDFCRQVSAKNPVVAGKLKRTDCSPISDGAAALLLTSEELVAPDKLTAKFTTIAQANDFMPMSRRDIARLEGCEVAWKKALQASKLTLLDLDFVETHDCFTIAELMQYEAMGLTALGEGAKALTEGWTYADGCLPINLSGGLKSKGHPIGATGVSMHALTAMQLTGRAKSMQLADCHYGGVFNMGGTGVANYVSILAAN